MITIKPNVQQTEKASDTLLAHNINEGVVDFVGELISGSSINLHLHAYSNPREKELLAEFKKKWTVPN